LALNPPRFLSITAARHGASMKLVITVPKPRNPIVAPARLRRAGSHRTTTKAQRQSGRQALSQALNEAARHGP
jgi:hypothetical protein